MRGGVLRGSRAEQVAKGELAERLSIMRGQHQLEVVDAGGRWGNGWLGLGDLAMDVATEDEGDRRSSWMALPVDVQCGEVLRIETQLDAPTDQRLIHAVAIAGQRDGGRGRDAAHDRPAERFAQQR